MNVCFVSPEYFPISGGTGAYVYYLSKHLRKLGHNIHVIARDGDDKHETVEGVNVTYLECEGGPFSRYWRFARSTSKKLQELSRESTFDIIHANLPLVPNFAVPAESSHSIVSTVHSTWKGEAEAIKHGDRRRLNSNEKNMLRFNRLLRSYEKRLMKRSDALIAVSEYTKRELMELYGVEEEVINVIYNGVDVQKFKPAYDKPTLKSRLGFASERVVLFVGRLYYRKGLSTLLSSIPSILEEFNNVEFVISGAGTKKSEDNLHQLVEELKIEGKIRFLGYTPDEKLPDLYAASDIFVLPALYENFPFAILEAQSTGLPVVTTKVGGIPELIKDNVNGLLVESGDASQLAEAILVLLRDNELAIELGEHGRKIVKEEFNWTLITSRVIELYRKIGNDI